MRTFKKLAAVFSFMPAREKLFVVVLTLVFSISLMQYFVLRGRINIENTDNYFIEGMIGDIHYLNPVFADYNDADRDLVELIFSGLIRYDPVQKNFYPDLAESIDRSSDGKKITLTLKPNLTWHDGAPITIDDILYTYRDVIQSPGFKNPVLRTAFEGVQIESPDANKIQFILPKANSYFISQLTVGILPKHILGELPVSELEKSNFNKNPIGSGPYRVVSASLNKSGDSVSMHAFENYYGDKPTIEKLRIVTFEDEDGLLAEIDALDSVAKIKANSAVVPTLESNNSFNIARYHLNQFTALYLNTDNALLEEVKLRKAITKSLNKEELITPGTERIDTLLLESLPTDEHFSFDPSAANALFGELGMNKNPEGIRYTSKGEKIVLPLLALDKVGTELPTLIAQELAEQGIEVPIRIAGEEEFTSLVNSRQYALLLIRQNLGYNRDVYPLFHSSQAQKLAASRSPGATAALPDGTGTPPPTDEPVINETPGLNFSNLRSFKTDGLTEAIRVADIPQDKEQLLRELSGILADQDPVIFISTPVYLYATNKSIAPFPLSALDFHSDRLSVLSTLAPQQ